MENDAFGLALSEASEQGSQVWHDIRAGRFTWSEISKLMDSGTRPMNASELKARPETGKGSKVKTIEDPSILSKPALTYIRNKCAETLTGMPTILPYSHATAHGDTWEPLAAEHFTEKTGLEFEILSFVPYGDHAGGSPDRKIMGKNEIVEFKCPYNSWNQVDYLMLVDQWDIKREYPEYYWQAQGNLLGGGFDLCHFCTYDYRMTEEKNKMVYIPIKPIEEDQDLIIKKLAMAIEEKLRTLQIIRNQKPTLVIK